MLAFSTAPILHLIIIMYIGINNVPYFAHSVINCLSFARKLEIPLF